MFLGLDESEEITTVPYTDFRSSTLLFPFVRGSQYPLLRATEFSWAAGAVKCGCVPCGPILDAFMLERNSADSDKTILAKKDRQPRLA
jgi:hypothetical protein